MSRLEQDTANLRGAAITSRVATTICADSQAAVCILCGATLRQEVTGLFDTRFGIPGSYEVWSCVGCGLEQIWPVKSLPELKSLYEAYYNFGGEQNTLYTKLREQFYLSALYKFWLQMDGDIAFHRQKGPGRLLDVGCNEGRGMTIYAANGFEVEGLELNESAAAVARRAGFIVHTCDISEFQPSSLFDIAILSNVLEHVPDPKAMLKNVHRCLKPGGQVWISCPNSRSWLRCLFGPSWINWHVPFHISHFASDTLGPLLRETGFPRVEIRQGTPALWVTHSLIAWLFAKKGEPTRELRNPFLVFFLLMAIRSFGFPALWMNNRQGRGDCLLVFATANS